LGIGPHSSYQNYGKKTVGIKPAHLNVFVIKWRCSTPKIMQIDLSVLKMKAVKLKFSGAVFEATQW